MGIVFLERLSVRYVVLCDFDGTVVDIDTAVFVLERFADPVWKVYDEQFERGEITLEECLQKQFSTVKVSEQKITKKLNGAVNLRRGFKELINYCRLNGILVVIVSAGLDFVIDYLLQQWGSQGLLGRYGPKTRITKKGILFKFPKLLDQASVNFKDDLVRFHKKGGDKVIYIGDGFSDYPGAKISEFAFAIKESKLAELLTKNRVMHKELSDFDEVLLEIKRLQGLEQ